MQKASHRFIFGYDCSAPAIPSASIIQGLGNFTTVTTFDYHAKAPASHGMDKYRYVEPMKYPRTINGIKIHEKLRLWLGHDHGVLFIAIVDIDLFQVDSVLHCKYLFSYKLRVYMVYSNLKIIQQSAVQICTSTIFVLLLI